MRITSVVVVALILTVGSDLELGAQVTRPRTNPGDRLPAPASVTAVQEADEGPATRRLAERKTEANEMGLAIQSGFTK